MDGKDTTGAYGAVQALEAGLPIPNLTEDRNDDGDIESLIRIRHADAGILHTVPDVLESLTFELALGFRKHFRLEIEQFQTATGYPARQLNAEVPGARP